MNVLLTVGTKFPTPSNFTNFNKVLEYAMAVTQDISTGGSSAGGLFGLGMLAMFVIISFLYFQGRVGELRAFAVTSFLATIISVMFYFIGIVGLQPVYLGIVCIGVSAYFLVKENSTD